MRTFLFGFLCAACALLIVAAFLVGRAIGPDATLRAAAEEDPDAWRLTLELAREGPKRNAAPPLLTPLAPRVQARIEGLETERPRAQPGYRVEDAAEAAQLAHRVEKLPESLHGPLLEAWHGPGRPAFRGAQVPTEEGRWVRDGPWEAWHENGVRHELGAYREGAEDGPWQWWYENGEPMAEGTFVDGERIGPWTFRYESGVTQMQGSYTGGEGSGLWTYWFEDGRVRAEGFMDAGELTGRWRVWNEDGSTKDEASGEFLNGKRVGD